MLRLCIVTLAILTVVTSVHAIDHKNWDEGRPLRLEDAYSISAGEIALEAGGGFALERRGPARGFFPVEVLYVPIRTCS